VSRQEVEVSGMQAANRLAGHLRGLLFRANKPGFRRVYLLGKEANNLTSAKKSNGKPVISKENYLNLARFFRRNTTVRIRNQKEDILICVCGWIAISFPLLLFS